MNTECAVCLDDIGSAPCQLSCRHKFHVPCLRTWVRRSRTCPLCRAPLGNTEYASLLLPRNLRHIVRGETEEQVRRELPHAFVVFVYDYTRGLQPTSVYESTWFISVRSPNWMPLPWRTFYEGVHSHQTSQAYMLSNIRGVKTVIRSVRGEAPRRLHFCRKCRGFVTCRWGELAQHHALVHGH
jgi:hypothetical protein